MRDWHKDIRETTKEQMDALGSYSPTSRVEDRMIKGCAVDMYGNIDKNYLSSDDLRRLAAACIEVANWLDARADDDA